MKRASKEENKEKKMYWKRIKGGNYTHKGIKYLTNEPFEAEASEIPNGALDVIKRCNEDGSLWVKEAPKGKAAQKKVYTKKARGKSKTWWDVYDENGTMINPRGIYEKDAEDLIKQLNKQGNEEK